MLTDSLVQAADEISGLIEERELPGFTSLSIDTPNRAVILRWKGSVPEALNPLLAGLSARGITVKQIGATYSLAELQELAHRLLAEERGQGVRIVAPANDGSGLEVGVLDSNVELSRIRSRYPITSIEVSGELVFLAWSPGRPEGTAG
jgi:hypothetical protein